MRKPKIQPLITLILRSRQIPQPLLLTHGPPNPLSIRIPFHIIHLGPQIQEYIQHKNCKEDVIPALVARRVVGLVDVGSDYARGLHTHVVQCCGDGAAAHGIGVTGVPAYLDWVG
jgi:hypothetical protein